MELREAAKAVDKLKNTFLYGGNIDFEHTESVESSESMSDIAEQHFLIAIDCSDQAYHHMKLAHLHN